MSLNICSWSNHFSIYVQTFRKLRHIPANLASVVKKLFESKPLLCSCLNFRKTVPALTCLFKKQMMISANEGTTGHPGPDDHPEMGHQMGYPEQKTQHPGHCIAFWSRYTK